MSEKPNILLIHADQHRWDCIGAYGNRDIQTPNIDRLAEEGVLYENSFCPHPVCTPSRYSLLTGLYIHQHMCLTNRSTLPAGIPTLPRQLKSHGYHTTAVGKMHFTPTYLDVGFDKMLLAEQCGDGRYDDDYHRWLQAEGLVDRVDLTDQVREFRQKATEEYWKSFGASTSDLDEEHHSTTWIGDRAVEELENLGDSPCFMMVGFIKPHHPFDPPHPWDEMYDPDELTLLPGWTESLMHGDDGKGYFDYVNLNEKRLRKMMAMYYATISQIDHQVGRMIETLKDRGIYGNTLILYTSDHGEYLGYHHRALKGYRMLEPLVRVPLIVKYAEDTAPKGRDERLVNNIDIAPTLLSAAGAPRPRTMNGMDLRDASSERAFIFAESSGEYMARSNRWKLLLHGDESQSMFFDLENDPLEMENLFAAKGAQEEIKRHREALYAWRLFESRGPNHVYMDAAQITAENVPAESKSLYCHVKKMMQDSDSKDQ